MGVYIKGMEMPTYEQGDLVLRVRWDGRVDKDYSGNTVATAVPVPPHGRLIDADAMQNEWFNLNFDRKITDGTLAYWNFQLSKIPTIIEAEEGE